VGVIALELKKADETNAAKAGAEAEALRSEIVALQSQLGSLVTQFGQQLERVEFAAKEEAKKLQLIPGPAGAAGASLNPRGTFIDGEVYNRLDVVSWLGSSYIATVDGVKEKPSKNSNQWQTLASRGGGGAGGVGDFGSLAGVAQINQGGTGQTTRVAALNALLPDQAGATQYILLTDGSGTVSWGAQPVAGLPSQTSNSGRLLTTNGSTASWSNAVTVSGSNATVGGTVFFSSSADVQASRVAAGVLDVRHPSNTTSRLDVTGATSAGLGLRQSGTRDWFVTAESNELRTSCLTANSVASYESGVLVRVRDTTASTTTSSGALVVGNGTSGGLGVGGAITAGGTLRVIGSSQIIRVRHDASNIEFTNTAQDAYVTGTVIANTLQLHGNNGTGLTIGSTGNATFGGNLTASGTGSHVFGTTNTVTLSSGAVTANGIISTTAAAQRVINTNGAFQIYKDATPTGAARFSYNTAAADTISLGVYDGSSWTDTFRVTTTQALVTTSTASNNTSSGALVVSGGVGVAGAIYAGGYLSTGNHARIGAQSSVVALSANNNVDGGLPAAWTGNYGVGVQYLGSSSNAFFIGDGSGGATYFYTRTSSTNTSRLAIDNVTGNITVPATAAATSASFGALVVGGGVGVAKEIITGGIVRCGGSNGLSLGSDTGNIRIDSAGPAGVEFRGLSAADTITGFTMREMALIDGTTAPSTRAGYATIYVDTADGDLKVKFGDGTVKTIATDS
jgi:hypothetical protein